jgi:predicted RNA binding protein YcfA (HicA-like mRNA interferase family)
VNPRKLLQRALASPANIRFEEACALARGFGFRLSRVNGSHHIFVHPDVRELVNLQDVRGKAKAYQVRQLLQLVERYNLSLGGEE